MAENRNFTPGHRQYLQWHVTISAEATTSEDVEFIEHMIDGALCKMVAELSGRQVAVTSHGPDRVLDLSD